MYPSWGPIAFSCHLLRWFGQNISCCHFWRVTFIVLGGQKYQHDDSLGSCTSIHYTSTLFPPTYDMRWLIDGKFRGLAAKVDEFISIWMFRGGRRQVSRGADSKYQYWYWTTINYSYCMGRALSNGPWYTWSVSMLMKGPLYPHGKKWRQIDVKIRRFYLESRRSLTSTKSQGL